MIFQFKKYIYDIIYFNNDKNGIYQSLANSFINYADYKTVL